MKRGLRESTFCADEGLHLAGCGVAAQQNGRHHQKLLLSGTIGREDVWSQLDVGLGRARPAVHVQGIGGRQAPIVAARRVHDDGCCCYCCCCERIEGRWGTAGRKNC